MNLFEKVALRDSYTSQGIRDGVLGVLPLGKIITTVIEDESTPKEKLFRFGARVAGSAAGATAGLASLPFSKDHSTRNLIKRVVLGSIIGEALLGPYPVREKLAGIGAVLKKVKKSTASRGLPIEASKTVLEEGLREGTKTTLFEKEAYRGSYQQISSGSPQETFGQNKPEQKGNLAGAIGKGVGTAVGVIGAARGGQHLLRNVMKNRTAAREFGRQAQMHTQAFKRNKQSRVGELLTPAAERSAKAQNRETALRGFIENKRAQRSYKAEHGGVKGNAKAMFSGFYRDLANAKNKLREVTTSSDKK